MSLPRTREELKTWCLKRLGHPVIEINVENSQLEGRIDEAIDFYRTYHFDAVERIYFKHQLQPSELEIVSAIGTFVQGERFVGSVSEAKGRFFEEQPGKVLFLFDGKEKQFEVNETITGQISGATAVLGADPETLLTLGDIDRGSIILPERILSVRDLFSFDGFSSGSGMFNVKYQFALNDMHSLASTDLISFDMFKRHLALLNKMFVGQKRMRFNRHMGEIFIDIDWYRDVKPGQYIILDCMASLDPDEYPSIYGDYFLRLYCYNLFKLQWGNNLKKYKNLQLPGGVTVDGDSIYQEAKQDLEKLEEKVKSEFMMPVPFLVG